LKTQVPLWLAIVLKKKKKCQIIPPGWLSKGNIELLFYSKDYLKSKLEEEKLQPGFSSLPFHYMEHSHTLLKNAADDIEDAEELRDIWELRERKVQAGFQTLDQHYLQMDHLGLLEINSLRPIFTKGMLGLYRILEEEQPLS
jgi:GINS complex subunit 2